jgi:hypothetical protein
LPRARLCHPCMRTRTRKTKRRKPRARPPKAPSAATPAVPSKGGAPRRPINLEEVTRLSRLGMWKAASIARVMGIPKTTFTDAAHGEEVREAIEHGRALFEQDAFEAYDRALKGGKVDKAVFILAIFKVKQVGWTDKQQIIGQGSGIDTTGARERLKELIERKRKLMADGGEVRAPGGGPSSGEGVRGVSPEAAGSRTILGQKGLTRHEGWRREQGSGEA